MVFSNRHQSKKFRNGYLFAAAPAISGVILILFGCIAVRRLLHHPEGFSMENLQVVAYLFILSGLILFVALISIFLWGARMRESFEICQIEAELDREKVSNQAKSDFLSNMSHELRTPMNAIVGITALAKRSVGDEQKTLMYLQKLEISTNYMLSLINDILDMSRIERGKMVLYCFPVSIFEMIEAVDAMIRQISQEKKQRFDVSVNVIHGNIVCDKARFQQVIVNLLTNAVKYTDMGGSIRLVVEERGTSEGKVRFYVEVSDTGIGIADEDLQRIFEPFEEVLDGRVSHVNQNGGTGLGLSICRNLLHMMGSEIQVKSSPGEGSVFFFEVEFEAAENDLSKREDEEEQGWNLEGTKMIVAEDNDMNRDLLVELLESEGVICVPAQDGQQAFELFRQSAPGEFDAILLDIQMPRMNGFEAAESIRNSSHPDGPAIPIVAMTAYVLMENMERGQYSGMDACTTKPIDLNELCKLLNRLLKKTGEFS